MTCSERAEYLRNPKGRSQTKKRNQMSVQATTKWLTACLYYHEPWEEFLAKAVKPYIDVVVQTGVADRFYFQRSWERGPHIRLFFKGNAYILENMLKPNLKEHFLQYFESRPSFFVAKTSPNGYHRFPENTVQFLDEGPGDLAEMPFYEEQWQASAQLVLQVLKEKALHWDYHEMMSTAIKMHLGFVFSAGLSLEEAQSFFQWMLEDWMKKNEANEVKNGKIANGGGLLPAFQKNFEAQQKDFIPYHAALWELLKNYRKIDDKEFVKWIRTSSSVSLKLGRALKPAEGRVFDQEKYGASPVWQFYAGSVHLVNNQLGLANKNEGYLYFTLSQSLLRVKKGLPSFSKAGA